MNNSSGNIKLSKNQLSKIVQLRLFLSWLWPLLKTDLSLMKNVLRLLAKSVSMSLGLTAAVSTTDAAVEKKMFGSGMTTLIISNEEMDDIIKTVKYFEDSDLMNCFLSMLLGTLGSSLLGNLLKDKGLKAKISGRGVIRSGEETIRVGHDV